MDTFLRAASRFRVDREFVDTQGYRTHMNEFTDTQRLDFILNQCLDAIIPELDRQQGVGDVRYDRATIDAAMHVWQRDQRDITTKRRHALLAQKALIETQLAQLSA